MKKVFALAGLTSALMLGSTMTAFAVGEPVLYGQQLQLTEESAKLTDEMTTREYIAIIPGVGETIPSSTISFKDGWTADLPDVLWTADPYEYIDEINWETFEMVDASGTNRYRQRVYFWRIPVGSEGNLTEEEKKYLIYPSGETQAAAADTGHWESNEKGWWIQYNDGHYLTNSWWQSPSSSLWYYMGADGYMVTNTVVDGYTINADGVWVH